MSELYNYICQILKPKKVHKCYFCRKEQLKMKNLDVTPWFYDLVCEECALIKYGRTLTALEGW